MLPGKYKCSDSLVAEYLTKFKMKEDVYKETICQLQQNNRELLEEVYSLKQDIVFYMCNDGNRLDETKVD